MPPEPKLTRLGSQSLRVRTRSSALSDLRIVLLGSWGFLRQCLKSWRRSQQADRGDLDA